MDYSSTMNNYRDEALRIGSTREIEMCYFYLMHWIDGPDTLKKKTCITVGPPRYYWSLSVWLLGEGLSNIPDHQAFLIEEKF